MRQLRGWILVMLCCATEAEAREETLKEAQTAFDEASTLWDAGQYDDAIARGEHALALREAVLGGTHPDVASCLDLLGLHLLLQGNSARAEPLLQRALAIREAALGMHHPEVAQTLNTLANLYLTQQLYARAEPLLQRSLAIREALLGKEHPLVAESLHNLARLYDGQELLARAELLYGRALAIREAALGKHPLELAQTLHDLAGIYVQQGLYARAKPLIERALAIRERAVGENHLLVAESLRGLASHYVAQGLYARAQPHNVRTQAILEAALGKNSPDVVELLRRLAKLYHLQGLASRAEPLYVRALAIREEALGRNHPLVADLLFSLAAVYQTQGLYGRAEPLLERTLAIREAALGTGHPLVADSLTQLAELYLAQGLYDRAKPLFKRALAMNEEALGKNNRYVADSLNKLAELYVAQGLYDRAEPLLQRALTMNEATLGKSFPFVSRSLNTLASLYLAQGLYARAKPLLERALAIREAAYGKNDPGAADSLKNLADLYSAQGLYGQAKSLYERALAIWEATAHKNHPDVAGTLTHLALVHLAQHRLAEALPLLTRALAISEQRLRQETLGFSEARLATFLQFLRTDEERLYALVRAHPDDASVKRLALGAALLLKGRSVEETAGISRTLHQSLGAQDRDTFERLGGLRTQLAHLSLQGPGSLPLTAYQQRLKELSEQGDALEADLAKRSAPLRALTTLPPPSEIVDRVATALPKDSALIEFITYTDRPLVPMLSTPEPQSASQLRYLALVLFPDATIRALDLGPAELIDFAALHLRDALANRNAAFQSPAQTLYQLAFQPLLPLLGGTRRLFLSPDGQLELVPFSALHDGHQFLVDAFDFTYLPSGKNLLPRSEESTHPASVVVLADPDFSASLPALTAFKKDSAVLTRRSSPDERFFSTLGSELTQRGLALTPLPGTRREAEAIQRLLPQAELFLGPAATKKQLLHLPTPGILHLATHGFFLEDAREPMASRAVGYFGALGENTLAPRPPDPLLRSGLVLAGARAPAPSRSRPSLPSPDSMLVTALELASLNLWGTQLVVLSACDTGRGDVRIGQGVYGLRRAFLVAGAETVVMSLWKVNDETTHSLMEAYYRNLLAGQGRATALREAMRELRLTHAHPHYWAPFITMGRDTALRLLTSTSQEAHHPYTALPLL